MQTEWKIAIRAVLFAFLVLALFYVWQEERHMPAGIHSELNPKNPPSAHAMGVLTRVKSEPFPVQEVNQTVAKKLLQFGYIRVVERDSPYKTHPPGKQVDFMVITEKGETALRLHKQARRVSRVMNGGLA